MRRRLISKPIHHGLLWGLVLILAAGCAGGLPSATPTAIPLKATATRRSPATPLPSRTPAPPVTSGPATAPAPTGQHSALDQTLARQTVEGFLARLVAGEARAAHDLYLTDRARAAQGDLVLAGLAPGASRLTGAELGAFGPQNNGFRAVAELTWERAGSGQGYAHTLSLAVRLDRGLWLIDELEVSQPTPMVSPTSEATTPPSAARRPAAPAGRLVFQAYSGGPLYVIHPGGTGLRRVASGLDPAWSPDGLQIATTRWEVPWGLYLLDADGVAIAGQSVAGQRLKAPAWSPDGRRLVVARDEGATEASEICFGGVCLPLPPVGRGSLWLVDLATQTLEQLPVPDRAPQSPTWSPDGARIAYRGDTGLAWVTPDGSQRGSFPGGAGYDGSPAYSPDGTRIAFMSRQHDHWELFVMNADGANRRLLPTGGPPTANNVAPAWSPDGQQIAFLSDRDGEWRIYLVDARRGGTARSMFGARLDGVGLRYDYAAERVLSWSR